MPSASHKTAAHPACRRIGSLGWQALPSVQMGPCMGTVGGIVPAACAARLIRPCSRFRGKVPSVKKIRGSAFAGQADRRVAEDPDAVPVPFGTFPESVVQVFWLQDAVWALFTLGGPLCRNLLWDGFPCNDSAESCVLLLVPFGVAFKSGGGPSVDPVRNGLKGLAPLGESLKLIGAVGLKEEVPAKAHAAREEVAGAPFGGSCVGGKACEAGQV